MSSSSNDGRFQQPNKKKNSNNKEKDEMRIWGILIFGVIGAAATIGAVSQLRNAAGFIYSQLSRQSSWKGKAGGSSRTGFQEQARRRYNYTQEEYEEERERIERMRRMQDAFNRERNKYKRSYERWSGQGSGAYHQDFQRDDWYWHDDPFGRSGSYGGANSYRETPQSTGSYSLSHHYSVLGLDRKRTKPYTDYEIKSAFREKAMKFHPDKNKDNQEAAEAKFKEVMTSYEAIKMERKNK